VPDEDGARVSPRVDVEARLRAARPDVQAPYPALSVLLRRIEQAEPAQPRRALRRRRLVLPLAIACLVLVAASAAAALLLTRGESVAPAFVLPATPHAGLGEPQPGTLSLLPMRVADPEGGPPWGMRVIRTTRGQLCLQAGRVVDGELGAIGSGYAFDGDGRFHPLLPEDAISTDACPAVGGKGAFLPGPPVIVPANALPLAGENVAPHDRVHCDLPGQANSGVRCPQRELRQVAVGLLGPEVRSIQVTTPDRTFTTAPVGPDGAYLIVLPAQPNANSSMSAGAYQAPFGYVSNAPGGAVLTVTYNDGSHCQIPIDSPAQQCHARGLADRPLARASGPTSALHVAYVPLEEHPVAPLLMDGAAGGSAFPGRTRPDGTDPPGAALRVSFRAPVRAPDGSSAYVVELKPRPASGCATPGVIVSQPTEQTIAIGAPVQIVVPLETACATSYSGRVFLARSSSIGGEGGGEGPLYEAIAAQYGPAGSGHHAARFATVGRFEIAVP
jgi:hypothetical protein